MGELVDHDVLRVVRIAGVAEQVFLGATGDRIRAGGAESARAAIPKLGRRHLAVFRHLRGELVVCHNDKAAVALDHVIDDVLPMADHMVDEIGRLLECIIRNFAR